MSDSIVHPNEKLVQCEYDGIEFKMIVGKRSKSDPFCLDETFNKGIYDQFMPHVANEVFVDVGVYIGDTAVLAAMNGARFIYGYEPHPIMFSRAVRNMHLNGFMDFKFYNVGLSNVTEEIYILGRPTIAFGTGMGPYLDPEKHTQRVKMVRVNPQIRKILNKFSAIGLLKIDAEGFEEFIIPMLLKKYMRRIHCIVVECHNVRRRKAVEARLTEAGMILGYSNSEYQFQNKVITVDGQWPETEPPF